MEVKMSLFKPKCSGLASELMHEGPGVWIEYYGCHCCPLGAAVRANKTMPKLMGRPFPAAPGRNMFLWVALCVQAKPGQ